MKLIDKDALVAEIERLSDIISQGMFTDESRLGIEYFKERVLSFLDTLEVKEVDLTKEMSNFIDAYYKDAKIGHKLSLRRTAKHFFELGMSVSNKTHKGE